MLKLTKTRIFHTPTGAGEATDNVRSRSSKSRKQSWRAMEKAMRQISAEASADDGGLARMKAWADDTFAPVSKAIRSGQKVYLTRDSVESLARRLLVCADEAERAVKAGNAKTALREGIKLASAYWAGAIEQRYGRMIESRVHFFQSDYGRPNSNLWEALSARFKQLKKTGKSDQHCYERIAHERKNAGEKIAITKKAVELQISRHPKK